MIAMQILGLLLLLIGYADMELGFYIEPPPDFILGSYSDTAGATWLSPDGKSELRLVVMPLESDQDKKKLLDSLVDTSSLESKDKSYLTTQALAETNAEAGMWTDIAAGVGSGRIRGRMYMLAGKKSLIVAIATCPLSSWESTESLFMSSLRSMKFLEK